MHKEPEFSWEGRAFWVKVTTYTKMERGKKYGSFEEHGKFCVHRAVTSLVSMLVFPFLASNEDARAESHTTLNDSILGIYCF